MAEPTIDGAIVRGTHSCLFFALSFAVVYVHRMVPNG